MTSHEENKPFTCDKCSTKTNTIHFDVNAYYCDACLIDVKASLGDFVYLAGYQRGVEDVLALLHPRQHAIMTFDELRQQARALITGQEVQR